MTDKVLRETKERLREFGATDFELVARGKGRALYFTINNQRRSVSLSKGFKTYKVELNKQMNAIKREQERIGT